MLGLLYNVFPPTTSLDLTLTLMLRFALALTQPHADDALGLAALSLSALTSFLPLCPAFRGAPNDWLRPIVAWESLEDPAADWPLLLECLRQLAYLFSPWVYMNWAIE
jgi:hypothetical protein